MTWNRIFFAVALVAVGAGVWLIRNGLAERNQPELVAHYDVVVGGAVLCLAGSVLLFAGAVMGVVEGIAEELNKRR